MTTLPIKLLISAVGLAFLLAAPAEAAKRKYRTQVAAKHAYTTAFSYPSGPNSVYYGSKYLGSDPDPRIRHELYRDLGAAFGGRD